MIKLENVVLPSSEQMMFAIQGMRNPLNSWDKIDSGLYCDDQYGGNIEPIKWKVGKNDLGLMKKLSKAGTDHRKFMRMMPVMVRITAPLYWVSEHDTYKVSTVRNSCSFMHKGVAKPFEISDFSCEGYESNFMFTIIGELNTLRDEYLKTKDEKYFFAIRRLLPSGYNVTYNWSANYEVLANIYHSRKNHRLPEWQEFCEWIETLPYSEIITGQEKQDA